MYPRIIQMETSRRLAEERLEAREISRRARKQAAAWRRRSVAGASDAIMIRLSRPDDRAAIEGLAALDGQSTPTGESILAFVDGELRAALPLGGGDAIADPFRSTSELVQLLRVRDAALNGTAAGGRRALRARVAAALRSETHRPALGQPTYWP
jgi:hypothetical protein